MTEDPKINLSLCNIVILDNKLAGSQVSSKVNKLVGSQVYSNVLFLVKYKIMIIIIVLKHRYSFSSQNSTFVYSIPDLMQNNPYYSFFSVHKWFGEWR